MDFRAGLERAFYLDGPRRFPGLEEGAGEEDDGADHDGQDSEERPGEGEDDGEEEEEEEEEEENWDYDDEDQAGEGNEDEQEEGSGQVGVDESGEEEATMDEFSGSVEVEEGPLEDLGKLKVKQGPEALSVDEVAEEAITKVEGFEEGSKAEEPGENVQVQAMGSIDVVDEYNLNQGEYCQSTDTKRSGGGENLGDKVMGEDTSGEENETKSNGGQGEDQA